jgi:hypothetical protein
MAELNTKIVTKVVLPRVLKAAVWGTFTFVMVYYLPLMLLPKDIPQSILPFDYTAQLLDFAVIAVFFAVVGQLFSGTVIKCGFGIARALVIIAYFFVVSEGGVFSVTFPISEVTVNVILDITVLLLMIISVNLLSIAKNLFEAINLLTEKSSRIDLT